MVWISPFWISISYPIINILLGIHLPIRAESAISLLSGSVCLFCFSKTWVNLCLGSGYFCCDETAWPQTTWRGFIWLICPKPQLTERSQNVTSNTEGSWRQVWWRHHGQVMFGLFPMISLACFLIELRATSPEVTLPKMEWGRLPQLVIEKIA
jgi:hypothetical protein